MQGRLQALLCGLLFFWGGGEPSAGRDGELCRAWSCYGRAPGASRGALPCPQRHGPADAQDCCGNCRLPFCCPRGKARLDWHRCRRALPDQEGVTRSRPTPPAATEKTPLPPSEIVLFAFLALVLAVALGVVLCHCRTGYRRRQRALRLSRVVQNLGELLPPPRSPFRLPFPAPPPPPYAEDPPPYSAEDPPGNSPGPPLLPAAQLRGAGAEDGEDGATVGPLVHRNAPGPSSEAGSPRETSAEE